MEKGKAEPAPEVGNEKTSSPVAEEEEEEEKGHPDEKDSLEKIKVQRLRTIVENQDPSCKGLDDLTIRRFLRARDLDIEKAASMLLKYLNWRQTLVPNDQISPSEIPNEIAQNKMYAQGFDKQGRPVSVAFGARHFINKEGGVDEFKRSGFIVFALDKLCARVPAGQEKFVIIGDLQGWGYANIDIRAYLGALSILQDYYPERLGKLFLIHVPSIFMAAWKIVYPFIDCNTKNKIIFVENKRLKATLLEDIEEGQLPEIYGGKLPIIPIQDA